MGNRKVPLMTGEYYHIYLRGVEKRSIVSDHADIDRFLTSLKVFNAAKSVGSIYEHSFRKENKLGSLTSKAKLVEIVAYNILDNHYHLLLKQITDGGISTFMHSLNGGYTKYFNHKYKRTGHLFQGTFGSAHISNDAHLIYTSVYVNLNHVVHGLGSPTSKWGKRSSWEQYIDSEQHIDSKEATYAVLSYTKPILSLYANSLEYKKEAQEIVRMIADERKSEKTEEHDTVYRHLEVGLPSRSEE